MACQLTYKNLKFDSIEQLSKFIRLENIISRVRSLDDVSNTNLRNLISPSLITDTDTKLQNTFNFSDMSGLVVEELYQGEDKIIEKFDSCYGRG